MWRVTIKFPSYATSNILGFGRVMGTGEHPRSEPQCPQYPLYPRGWVAPSGVAHPPYGGGAPHPGSAARLVAAFEGGATGTVGTTHAGSGRGPGAWRSGGEAGRLYQRRSGRVEGAGCEGTQPERGDWASRAEASGGKTGPLGTAEGVGVCGSSHG